MTNLLPRNTAGTQITVEQAREAGWICLTPLERQFAMEFVVSGNTLKQIAAEMQQPRSIINGLYNSPLVRGFIYDLQQEVLQHKLINEAWVEGQLMRLWPQFTGQEDVALVDKNGVGFTAKKFHAPEVAGILKHFGGNKDQKGAGGVMVQINFGAMGVDPPQVKVIDHE